MIAGRAKDGYTRECVCVYDERVLPRCADEGRRARVMYAHSCTSVMVEGQVQKFNPL